LIIFNRQIIINLINFTLNFLRSQWILRHFIYRWLDHHWFYKFSLCLIIWSRIIWLLIRHFNIANIFILILRHWWICTVDAIKIITRLWRLRCMRVLFGAIRIDRNSFPFILRNLGFLNLHLLYHWLNHPFLVHISRCDLFKSDRWPSLLCWFIDDNIRFLTF